MYSIITPQLVISFQFCFVFGLNVSTFNTFTIYYFLSNNVNYFDRKQATLSTFSLPLLLFYEYFHITNVSNCMYNIVWKSEIKIHLWHKAHRYTPRINNFACSLVSRDIKTNRSRFCRRLMGRVFSRGGDGRDRGLIDTNCSKIRERLWEERVDRFTRCGRVGKSNGRSR